MKFKALLSSAVICAAGLPFTSPAQASAVDAATHQRCINAKDYAGCVSAQSGATTTGEKVKDLGYRYVHLPRHRFEADKQSSDDDLVIIHVEADSGAESAGLKAGHVITAVNGEDVTGLSIGEVEELTKDHFSVTLLIRKGEDAEPEEVIVTRKEFVRHPLLSDIDRTSGSAGWKRWVTEVPSAAVVYQYYNHDCPYGTGRVRQTRYKKFFGIKHSKKITDGGCQTTQQLADSNAKYRHQEHMRNNADAMFFQGMQNSMVLQNGLQNIDGSINRIGNIMEYGYGGY